MLELIFIKSPDKYLITQNDYNVYKKIVLQTNAHRNYYTSNGVIRRQDP